MTGPRRRAGPVILGALSVMFLALSAFGWWQRTFDGAGPAVTVIGHAPGGAACLDRAQVIAGLAARGIRATPEPPPFCVTPPGLTDWLALSPAPPEGTHLAFDINGCLTAWAPCPS